MNNELMISMERKPMTYNKGYGTNADFCKRLILYKGDVKMELIGKELAQLYNFIKPVGCPAMEEPV